MNNLLKNKELTEDQVLENIDQTLIGLTSTTNNDAAALVKYMVHFGLYLKTIKNLGTEKHKTWLREGINMRDLGCYGLTEAGHGSNVRGLETTARFDPDTQEFVFNSPTQTSAKFWIGNLARTAQTGVFWAQLITPDGKGHGPHAFVF